MPGPTASFRTREGAWVLGLALLAGLRIGAHALAFPFFSNVDEYRHFDVVLKYSRGALPGAEPVPYESETAEYIGRFGSPEYLWDASRGAAPTPRAELAPRRIAAMRRYLAGRHSLEAPQPPLYYASAGAWFALGRALGLEGLALLYWLRSLSFGVGCALVLVSWAGLRAIHPREPLLRLGVPALLASIPQDCLYYVTSDLFSPWLGAAALLAALRLMRDPAAGVRTAAFAGAWLAAAGLAKYPNLALASGSALACALALRGGAWRARGRAWLAYWAAALLPLLLWWLRNRWLGGSLTGTDFKVERLGWSRQVWPAHLAHPIFTPEGAWAFVSELLPRLWRGELAWQRAELALPAADAFYLAVSLLALAAAVASIARRGPRSSRAEETAALLCVASSVALLGLLSLLFVFGEDTSPSRAYPYFANGRLMAGALLPFAWLVVRGIEGWASLAPAAWREALGWSLLALVIAVCWSSELALDRPVFASAYNAFHGL